MQITYYLANGQIAGRLSWSLHLDADGKQRLCAEGGTDPGAAPQGGYTIVRAVGRDDIRLAGWPHPDSIYQYDSYDADGVCDNAELTIL